MGLDPFLVLAVFKNTLFEAGAVVRKLIKEAKVTYLDELAELLAIIKGLRLVEAGSEGDLAEFDLRHTSLAGLGRQGLRDRAASLFLGGHLEAKASKPAASSARKPTALDKIKLTLPSSRTRLHALRAKLEDAPSSDPEEMAGIASTCWTKVWSRRVLTEESISPDDYFGDYQLHIPVGLTPVRPGVGDMEDAILQSNNSVAGPDGIPFAAWRATSRFGAPVLLLVMTSLMDGVLPPDGFNYGLLFLIPKTGTLLPEDTRPISVTNSDNRIIAKAIVAAITPALLVMLHRSQKGFISTRVFEDHIRDLNERFYEMAEGTDPPGSLPSGRNLYVLFMDTAKAFDSIDHVFVHEAIRRTGLPDWFGRLVVGLLHSVKVKPAFKGASDHWIDILRGVKQGCPLSPLLFVICYDVLLRRLAELDGVDPFACADDLALAAANLLALWEPMRLVDRFRLASGLGINKGKTSILSARESATLRHTLLSSPWPEVSVSL